MKLGSIIILIVGLTGAGCGTTPPVVSPTIPPGMTKLEDNVVAADSAVKSAIETTQGLSASNLVPVKEKILAVLGDAAGHLTLAVSAVTQHLKEDKDQAKAFQKIADENARLKQNEEVRAFFLTVMKLAFLVGCLLVVAYGVMRFIFKQTINELLIGAGLAFVVWGIAMAVRAFQGPITIAFTVLLGVLVLTALAWIAHILWHKWKAFEGKHNAKN